MHHKRFLLFLCMVMLMVGCQSTPQPLSQTTPPEFPDPARWENTIAKFRTQDKANPPAPGGFLFVGSSSIRLWDLDHWFPGLRAVNRGFGGSHVEDSVVYYEDLVKPHAPDVIVMYAGDNDVQAGKSPQRVFDDYQMFVGKARADFPDVDIIYVAIKPSLSRWDKVGAMREANSLIETYASHDAGLHYLDIDTPMIGDDGTPREELFVSDGLHLSEEGYRIWSERLWHMLGSVN